MNVVEKGQWKRETHKQSKDVYFTLIFFFSCLTTKQKQTMPFDSSSTSHPIISSSFTDNIVNVSSSPPRLSVDSFTSASSTSSSYTVDRLKRLLETQKHKYCILKNELSKEV